MGGDGGPGGDGGEAGQWVLQGNLTLDVLVQRTGGCGGEGGLPGRGGAGAVGGKGGLGGKAGAGGVGGSGGEPGGCLGRDVQYNASHDWHSKGECGGCGDQFFHCCEAFCDQLRSDGCSPMISEGVYVPGPEGEHWIVQGEPGTPGRSGTAGHDGHPGHDGAGAIPDGRPGNPGADSHTCKR